MEMFQFRKVNQFAMCTVIYVDNEIDPMVIFLVVVLFNGTVTV